MLYNYEFDDTIIETPNGDYKRHTWLLIQAHSMIRHGRRVKVVHDAYHKRSCMYVDDISWSEAQWQDIKCI